MSGPSTPLTTTTTTTTAAATTTIRYRHNASVTSSGRETDNAVDSDQQSRSARGEPRRARARALARARASSRAGRSKATRKRQLAASASAATAREDDERCLRRLRTATAVVSIAIVGALVGLAYLLLVIDPELRSHLQLQEWHDRFVVWGRQSQSRSRSQDFPSSTSILNQQPVEEATEVELEREFEWDTSIIDERNNNEKITVPENEGKYDNSNVKEYTNHDPVDENDESHQSASSSPSPSPSSPIYIIPNSMAHIGDKSKGYARLRQEWDKRHPPNHPERPLRALEEILAANHQKNKHSSILHQLRPPPNSDSNDDLNYDIYDCPDEPPPGYPLEYSTMELLRHWPPTQTVPTKAANHYRAKAETDNDDGNDNGNGNGNGNGNDNDNDNGNGNDNTQGMWAHLGICVFDYHRDYEKALRYRSNELPFVVRNDPSVAETVERWNDEGYRRKLFGNMDHTGGKRTPAPTAAENSDINHSGRTKDIGATEGHDDPDPSGVYHRAERAITNQILFRHAPKSKPPSVNRYPKTRRKKPKPSRPPTDDHAARSPRDKLSPPRTKLISMTYDQWYERAMQKEQILMAQSNNDNGNGNGNGTASGEDAVLRHYDTNLHRHPASYYYYFRLVGCGEKDGCEKNSTEYLFDELPFFQPRKYIHPHGAGSVSPESKSRSRSESSQEEPRESLYIVEPDQQRGIHCRFGMPGMIAANHYDASRNAIVVLGGTRRYILSRPSQCKNMGLFPAGHTSARHSKVDWAAAPDEHDEQVELELELAAISGEGKKTDHDRESESEPSPTSSDATVPWKDYRNALSLLANHAKSTEVILEAGDVLYLPSYWFHYIVSLDTNMQCNTRSGKDDRDDAIMTDCGFPPKKKRKH